MTMEVRAVAKFQRVSPRKARLVADVITGKSAGEALAILEHMPKSTAHCSRASSARPWRTRRTTTT